MWCSVDVLFSHENDKEEFLKGNFGDMEPSEMSVMCYGNHRLLNDVHSWVQDNTSEFVTTIENIDGYNITTVYHDGIQVDYKEEEEEREA